MKYSNENPYWKKKEENYFRYITFNEVVAVRVWKNLKNVNLKNLNFEVQSHNCSISQDQFSRRNRLSVRFSWKHVLAIIIAQFNFTLASSVPNHDVWMYKIVGNAGNGPSL